MALFSDILLTVDFDRTLTAPDSTIPQRNMDAIAYFIENGGSFTINTGRSLPMCEHNILGKVPVNVPLLLYNGSAAYDVEAGRFTRYAPLDIDPSVMLADLLTRFPELNLEIQAMDAHYALCKNPRWEDYSRHNQCAWKYTAIDSIPQPLIKVSLYGQFRENTVAGMYQATPAELALFDQAIAYVEKVYGDKVCVFRACARIADIHAKGVSKLTSARQLQKQLNKRLLICVGDAENDITMLDGADYAFCPSDGLVADRYENVCCCSDGAVADVIFKKIPVILSQEP